MQDENGQVEKWCKFCECWTVCCQLCGAYTCSVGKIDPDCRCEKAHARQRELELLQPRTQILGIDWADLDTDD